MLQLPLPAAPRSIIATCGAFLPPSAELDIHNIHIMLPSLNTETCRLVNLYSPDQN